MRRRVTLAGQLLVVQVVILLVVLVAVAIVSLAQTAEQVRREEGRRALSVAEVVAALGSVRSGVASAAGSETALAGVVEGYAAVADVDGVAVADEAGRALASTDPREVDRLLDLGDSDVIEGRAWIGLVDSGGRTAVAGHAPVLDDEGQLVGLVAVAQNYPGWWERLLLSSPYLLTHLGVASLLGLAGSWLLARRVKRQTLGMEPREIATLVQHRSAMLRGIREGVVGLDPEHRVTVVNAAARDLLGLPFDALGRSVSELGADPAVRQVLVEESEEVDRVVVVDGRAVIVNRVSVTSHGRPIGAVVTLRDRSELVSLQSQLTATRNATETLRAQGHEFANQLHVISGLIEAEEFDEVVDFVHRLVRTRATRNADIQARIADPPLAALLEAKSSLAAERGVGLLLTPGTSLGRVEADLSDDLATVVGNLVDNALDALSPNSDGWVEVDVRDDGDDVVLQVRDTGPGIDPDLAEQVFHTGFSTKATAANGERGYGLAITAMVCARRGGRVDVRNDSGAVFTARLPRLGAAA